MLHKKLLSIIAIAFTCFSARAATDGDEGEPVSIGISIQLENSIPPKSPVQVPIVCTLYASLSYVDICFLANLGFVTIEIENQTTGEYDQAVVDALAGQLNFFFSGGEGFYEITFRLSNGQMYNGYFEIV